MKKCEIKWPNGSFMSTLYSSKPKDTCALLKMGKWIYTNFTDHFYFAWKNSKFSEDILQCLLTEQIPPVNMKCVTLVLAEDCLFDMLSCLGIRNTIVTFQPDGFYYYFENNNTWSIENLLRDYYAYSKCIPTGMVFCPLWTDTSFVNCTGCSGKKFWILETSYNKGNIKSDYLSNCR